MQDEIKKQIIAALDELNNKYEDKYTFTFQDNRYKVTNMPEEIDKFEDAAPFHDKNCKDNGSFCPCRYCRTWCPCMSWWREKQKDNNGN